MDLTAYNVKMLFYLILVCTTTLFIYYQHESYWLVLSAFTLAFIHDDKHMLNIVFKLILTTIIIASIVLFGALSANHMSFYALFLAAVVFVCILLSTFYFKYIYSLLLIGIFSILSTLVAYHTIKLPLINIFYIGLGALIALIYKIIFIYDFKKNQIDHYTYSTLRHLILFNKDIFACFLNDAYSQNIYLFEKRMHIQKRYIIQSLSRLREITDDTKKLFVLDSIFDTLIQYSQLRRRVKDYTIFHLCKDELTALERTINTILRDLKSKKLFETKDIKLDELMMRLNRMEESFEHVLKVVSKEPLIFLFFLQSIYSFEPLIYAIAENGKY